MAFYSIIFLCFFAAVFIIYYAIPRKHSYLCLLAASWIFYFTWSIKYAAILAVITMVSYIGAICLEKYRKKLYFTGGLLICFGIFAFFKYGAFAVSNINRVLGILHIREIATPVDLVIPVGISFYTLQAAGYLIDVYKRKIKPEYNLARYALFVSFFPTILSGPIERSDNLLKQLQKETAFSYEDVKAGILLMVYGYFEKILIANRISGMVNLAFADYTQQTGLTMMFAVVLYAVQIYADFSGYSHIALGISRTFGLRLIENFKQPYFALSIKDFWRRWHISLSGWLKDYVYIPLGGSRCGRSRNYLNLLLTFLVSGLWHGAGWNYIVWGGLHGIYQIASQLTFGFGHKIQNICKIKTDCFSYRLFQGILTFCMVDFAWLFFRATSLSEALHVLKHIILHFNLAETIKSRALLLGMEDFRFVLLFMETGVLLVVDVLHEKKCSIITWLNEQNLIFRWMCYLSVLLILVIGAVYDYGVKASTFIYSQF